MESYISEIVLEALRVEIKLAHRTKGQADKQNTLLAGQNDKLTAKIKKLTLDIERSKNAREQLFEDFADGKLTKKQYVEAKSELTDSITTAEAEIEQLNSTLLNKIQHGNENTVCGIISKYADATSVNDEIAGLIKRISVFADDRIVIKWNFSRGVEI
jgi:chromosome segregation ATPase